MLKEERLAEILDIINQKNYVNIKELQSLTNSSESTIRADLVELANEKKIIRLHGGAQALNKNSISYELSIQDKMEIQVDAKKNIAEYAAKLIENNSTIYIDAGTTTYYLADYITAKNVTIVTNSVIIARRFKVKGYQVYVIGGEYKLKTEAFIGTVAKEILAKFHFDSSFIGCNGVDLESGFTTPDIEEALIKGQAMNQSSNSYILADHSKFDVKTAVRFYGFEGTKIITDVITNKKYLEKGIIEAKKK